MKFSELYKQDNALLTCEPAFVEGLVEGLIKELQSAKSTARNRPRKFKIAWVAAAVFCFAVIGVFYASQIDGSFEFLYGKSENEGMVQGYRDPSNNAPQYEGDKAFGESYEEGYNDDYNDGNDEMKTENDMSVVESDSIAGSRNAFYSQRTESGSLYSDFSALPEIIHDFVEILYNIKDRVD